MKSKTVVQTRFTEYPRRRARGAIALFWALALSAVWPAIAQTPPEDEAMTRARQAYDMLPAAERRAIQDNLVWMGIYKGVVDGEFGRMTFNAMRAYTSRRPGAAPGILTAPERAALAAQAVRAKTAVDFRIVQEPRAGFAIGIPQKVFVRRSDVQSGARFETADRSAGVETFRMRESANGLQAFYDALRAPAPNRRVTYSVLRPDFFVVTVETPTRASYTRVARGLANNETTLRGFTASWPKAQQARYESLTVAIANAFDPFGQKAAVARTDTRPSTGSADDGSQRAPAALTPPTPVIASTAVALASNRFVAVLPSPVCKEARIGGRPARLLRHDPAAGLALFDVAGANAARLRAPAQAAQGDMPAVVLFAAPGERPDIGGVALASGVLSEPESATKTVRVRVFLPSEAAGAPVFSRKGELFGLIAPLPPGAQRIAGAPLPASRLMIAAETLSAFAAASGLELLPPSQGAAESSPGKLAADLRGAIEALWCMPPSPPR